MSRIHTITYGLVNAAARFAPASSQPGQPERIFCLRNNDLGDVVVITPIFEALRRRFPSAEILAGVGSWAADVLKNNPFVGRILPVNGPWHNKFSTGGVFYASRKGIARTARYILFSREARALAAERCAVGIDILGSPEGAALLMRAGIPYRLGVRGYAGGDRTAQRCLEFTREVYVGRFALRFAELLGLPEADLPPAKPQIYLTGEEARDGRRLLGGAPGRRKIVVGFSTGGGPGRVWPTENFRALIGRLDQGAAWDIALVGTAADRELGDSLAAGHPSVSNLAGRTSLRETFSLVHAADAVVCSASMLMHVAAAFEKRTAVVLGPNYPSATEEATLWNCNPGTAILGKEPGRDRIATPDEVLAWVGSA